MGTRRRSSSGFNFNDNAHLITTGGIEDEITISESPISNGQTNILPMERAEDMPAEVEAGNLNLLSQKFESLDYDLSENTVYMDYFRDSGYKMVMWSGVLRWIIVFFIGILTAVIASAIDMTIESVSFYKYSLIKSYMDTCSYSSCLIVPYILWLLTNAAAVGIAAMLVAYVEPVAIGSGIPQIKCYLNGIKIPRVVRLKTLICKAVGVTLSVIGGLAIGKEGPMIHSGAVVAAGLSQGKSTSMKRDFKVFNQFRTDKDKRDFVSAGAAAGVSAAFGAPVGGVLFSLEEGASFWNQNLTWRIFFCSMVSTFTLNLILSAYHNKLGQLSFSGLLNFGEFDNVVYGLSEFPIYLGMGIIGGLLGALFNHINYKLSVYRMRYLTRKWALVFEAIIVSVVTASVGFMMIYSLNDCKPIDENPDVVYPVRFHCDDGYYNSLAAIWFQTPEESVRSFFHNKAGNFTPLSVFIFFACYFLLSTWTYGVSVPSGLFIPCLLTGAAWGRLIGMLIHSIYPDQAWADPGKFALIGAAAQLGGVVRMTISLTVILIEATGNITFGLPIMIVLMIAKWVGDFFNEGLYDIHIQLSSIPLLGWEPPPLSQKLFASEVMSHPVITMKTVENVGTIVKLLKSETHNAFPVIDPDSVQEDERSFGRFRGLILRTQLIILLKHKIFNETSDSWNKLTYDDFVDEYPRYTEIQQVHVSSQEMNFTIDLRPFVNPSSYTVTNGATLPRIFRLFRALGLRHIVVVNDRNHVIGIVTRKDIARYRLWHHAGKMGMEELRIIK